MTLVVDASAIAAMVFGEADGETIAAHIEGETLVAPTLIDYELVNTAAKKIRRQPNRQTELLASVELARRFAITRVPVSPFDALPLALETGLSGYDAAYLWLAISQDLELVTLDHKLARVNQARRERP